MRTPRTIAVFLPNWVGDVVMATPALRALRESFPAARITYVGREVAIATLAGLPWEDFAIRDSSRDRPRLRNALRLRRELRRTKFDLAILLPNSFRSAMLARLGGAKRIAGYNRDGRGWLLSDKLQAPRRPDGSFKPAPMIGYYNALAAAVGARPDSNGMELAVTADCESRAQEMFSQANIDPARPIVMLNPGASFGYSKMWLPERFAAVADALVEGRGAQIIINAAPAEKAIAAEVAVAMTHAPAINFAEHDNTIGLLKSFVRRCGLLITNDTGVRHFAAAFGIGVVTVFGSTDPLWAEINYERERIIRVDVPCSPCQSKRCRLPAGPTFHQCMTAITPEMVLAAAQALLDEPQACEAAGGCDVD